MFYKPSLLFTLQSPNSIQNIFLNSLRYNPQNHQDFNFLHLSFSPVDQDSESLIVGMASNRSPSPLSSRNCRNSESNSTTRKSFSGNPFPRPSNLTNPKSSNPYTPSNTPTASDLAKRNLIIRKSIGGGSMFQDGKENRKDAFRSPAKVSTKNFMSPTISAASKVTPSPRKKILGEKNDVTRASFEFLGKESDLTFETPNFDQTVKMNEESDVSKIEQIVEQKEVVQNVSVDEVHLGLNHDESDLVRIRPFCCSPMTSPVIAANADPQLPPYDPKKNFLSPRPQYLRYKPNPRIEFLLNKEDNYDDCGESDVTRLEDSFDLSDSSSETEEKEPEPEQEKEAESGDDSVNSVNGSETDLSDTVLDEKPFDSKAEKVSKPRFFTRSKTVSFVFVLFLVACFSLSFTESPPINLPIYEDVGFSEIYHESLRFAAFAKESFDDLVEKAKNWSMDLLVYLSEQKSLFITPQKFESLQFFNLTTSPIQEEFVFNRHIGTDYIQEVQEFEEEEENEDEVVTEESDVVDEDVTEEIDEQSDVVNEETERIEEPINEQIQSDVKEVEEKSLNLGEVEETKSEVTLEAESERVQNDVEIEPSVAVSNDESEASSLFSTQSIATISVAGVSMVILAVLTVFYMIQKKKSNASKSAAAVVNNDDNMPEESGSSESINVEKGNKKKKKSNKKRESLASSTSQFSVSDSFGSFTTFERIAIKHKDEVMLTPIRRSSRLLKSQGISS
ncbi:hypothetical protein Hdeb2414_s0004g00142561 [Helianthus debilis subsp. tardiflorus]